MRGIINHLVQLQELILIREQEAFMGGDRLKQLDSAIKEMTDQLPPAIRTKFLRLQKKDTAAVVPIGTGACSTCGMKLPISLVQMVRAEKALCHCPNCTRILYYSDSPARSVARKQSRTAPRKVGIERFSSQQLMMPRLHAKNRDDAIAELATRMEDGGFVKEAQDLTAAALRREAVISTAVDHGVAFPHVRNVQGGGLTLALGLSAKGIRFNPQEKALSRIIFFIVIPPAANAFYLKLLAGLTETFMQSDARASLMAEKEPGKLWKTLKKLTRRTIR